MNYFISGTAVILIDKAMNTSGSYNKCSSMMSKMDMFSAMSFTGAVSVGSADVI